MILNREYDGGLYRLLGSEMYDVTNAWTYSSDKGPKKCIKNFGGGP